MTITDDQIVKSCPKLESGLRLGVEGLLACQVGPFCSPVYFTPEQLAELDVTRDMIADRRKWAFDLLNDETASTPCKHCHMVVQKKLSDVRFDQLGHIDLAATTTCNLRCTFCGYTQNDKFQDAKFDALKILRLFAPEDVVWNAAVDFNGGEPTLLKDFDEYVEYFNSRRIRVFLYTNGVIYKQSVYDGLKDGSIQWVCVSLDAGTPSTYKKTKVADRYVKVLENISRYADAGSKGGGRVAVKYIFTQDNSGDDDVTGFAYAMLALRPQEIWLTFDFEPLRALPGDRLDFGGHDYSKLVDAYANTYLLLEKHGLRPVHFPEKHLANVSIQGKWLLEQAKLKIASAQRPSAVGIQQMALIDFRHRSVGNTQCSEFTSAPLSIRDDGEDWRPWSLDGLRVVIAPACKESIQLLENPELKNAHIVGFCDRDPVLHGKFVGSHQIRPYEDLPSLLPDAVLIAGPTTHHNAIAASVAEGLSTSTPAVIAIYIAPSNENSAVSGIEAVQELSV